MQNFLDKYKVAPCLKEKKAHEFGHKSNLLPGKKGFAKAVFPDLCSNIGKKINRQGKF